MKLIRENINEGKGEWNVLWGYSTDALLIEVIRRYPGTPIGIELNTIIDKIHIFNVKLQNKDES